MYTYGGHHLNVDEMTRMESIADQIRISITGQKGIMLDDYVKKASTIPLLNIGIENINEIKDNEGMQGFFPDKVWEILKKRCDVEAIDDINIIEFENEKEIIIESNNIESDLNKDIAINKSISKANKYDEKTMNFIRSNAHMGCRWIADHLGYTYDAIQKKCKREKIELAKKQK